MRSRNVGARTEGGLQEFLGGICDKRGRHACYLCELCKFRTVQILAQAHASFHTACVFQEEHNVICAHPKVVILFIADRIVHMLVMSSCDSTSVWSSVEFAQHFQFAVTTIQASVRARRAEDKASAAIAAIGMIERPQNEIKC